MADKSKIVLKLLCLVFMFESLKEAESQCSKPSSLPPSSRYLANSGCIVGATYSTATETCYCWTTSNPCGYICTKNTATTLYPASTTAAPTSTTPPTTTGSATSCPPSPLPGGGRWVGSSGCFVGQSYTTSTKMCTCCGNVGYLCVDEFPSTTTASTPTTTTRTTVTTTGSSTQCPPSPLPSGGKWMANSGCIVGPSYSTSRQTCTCCGKVGYLCVS